MTSTNNSIAAGLLIRTRFLGPTNHRGSRVKAICKAPSGTVSVTLDWNDANDASGNHLVAAQTLAEKMSGRNEYNRYEITGHAWDNTDEFFYIAEPILKDRRETPTLDDEVAKVCNEVQAEVSEEAANLAQVNAIEAECDRSDYRLIQAVKLDGTFWAVQVDRGDRLVNRFSVYHWTAQQGLHDHLGWASLDAADAHFQSVVENWYCEASVEG